MDEKFTINKGSEDKERSAWFILECFRNPYEINFFRSRYSEFYLLSLFTPLLVREKRFRYFSKERDERDQGDDSSAPHKLNVRSCVTLSDIALTNKYGINESDKSNYFDFVEKLFRYIALIRMPGCIPPQSDELFMHLSYSLSLMSSCVSRKVGAVIVGPNGYIYGAGWNDVSEGQIGCGFRTKEDYLTIESIPKTVKKNEEEFFKSVATNGKYPCYKDILAKPDSDGKKIKRLEHCRALHAEENALLQTTKMGGMPVIGGSIYTTTLPCELCAKKIYQTGINTIYFTEPYPESISDEVFLEDGNRRIERIPFEGVKSNSFYRLYKPIIDKKDYSRGTSIRN